MGSMCWFSIALPFLLLLLLPAPPCRALPEEDSVVSLPLFGSPPTLQFSGYLDATAGCDTAVNGDSCQIHYWMALAKGEDWKTRPVVLFLNGGPGSSSLLGFLQEVGPLLINAQGGLMENPYSWNTVANLFVMESPVGVGFSYCAAQRQNEKTGRCTNTDKFTASAARAAMVDFFNTKFPELRDNDFFITGESYAGVYIPTMTYEILTHNRDASPSDKINLRGIAVGDPCTDNDAQREAMDPVWYAHKYGLLDDTLYETLRNQCKFAVGAVVNGMNEHDPFDIPAEDVAASTTATIQEDAECTMAFRKFKLSTSDIISGKWKDRFVDRFSLFAPVTDVVDNLMTDYLNRPDVQEALHVTEAPVTNWTKHGTKDHFSYTKEYDACNRFADDDSLSMIDFYRKIVPQLDIAWIFNGDTDPAVSYEGTRTAIKRVGFPEVDGGGYRPWFYNHTASSLDLLREKAVMFGPDLLLQDTGAQFGGEVVNYENNLAFLTVHGSGHMVPQFRPQAALHMLSKLISFEDLSPLLPTNATLSAMTDIEFSKLLDEWTESAKGAPFVT